MNQTWKRNLEIIRELTLADFKGKYKNSVLGFFWSFLNPLLIFSVLYLVFTVIIKLKVPHYQLYLLLGIIIWTYFAESTITGIESIVRKRGLITKIAVPPETIIISSALTSSLTFFLNLVIFFLLMFSCGVFFSWEALYFILVFIELFFFILGITFALGALYVRYQDLAHIWGVLLQAWFWLTPIVYSLDLVPERILKFYMLNPLARIIHSSRTALIYHYLTSFKDLFITLVVVMAVFGAGLWIFKKEKAFFPERV